MKVQVLWIPACLPSANQLIGGKVRDRIALKRQWRDVIVALVHAQRLGPQPSPVRMRYDFAEQNTKRDLSNLIFGAIKIIEDSLVHAGVLADDSQKHVCRIEIGDVAINRAAPGVRVTLESL